MDEREIGSAIESTNRMMAYALLVIAVVFAIAAVYLVCDGIAFAMTWNQMMGPMMNRASARQDFWLALLCIIGCVGSIQGYLRRRKGVP